MNYNKVNKKNKKIIIISGGKIKTKEIRSIEKIIIAIMMLWVAVTSLFFFLNIGSENRRIAQLKNLKLTNQELNKEIAALDVAIENFVKYFDAINNYDKFDKFDLNKERIISYSSKNNKVLNTTEYKNIMPVLKRIDDNMSSIKVAIDSRISGLKDTFNDISLSEKVDKIYESQSDHKKDKSINGDLKYLTYLESFMNSIPVSKPMKNYYLSSKYGNRIDPFSKKTKLHKGLDFAGPHNASVLATADGVVKLVTMRHGFGNVIILDHGNGIETVYAHLKKPLVKQGESIKRGKVIAVQGSSGRATGDHLHYEVKVNKVNYDPGKFLDVGKKMGF